MPAEQQVGRQHDDHLGDTVRQELTRNEQPRADQDLRERVAGVFLLLILGSDDAGLALDGLADLTDPGKQGIRVFAGHAQLFGLIDQHAVVHAVELTDLVLHLRRAVRAAEVLNGVHALIAIAAVLGRRHDDFGLALNRLADLTDPGKQGVRVFTGHAELAGLVDQHAVVHTVKLADLVLHFGGTVRAAQVLHRVYALDAVRSCRMVVVVPVVMAAAACMVMVVVLMVVVVMPAGAFAVVMVVLMMFMAAGTSIIMMVVLVVMMVVMVVTTGAFTVVVVMMVVYFLDFTIMVVNVIFYIGMFSTAMVI